MHLDLVRSAALLLAVVPLGLGLPVDRIRAAVDKYLEERAVNDVFGIYNAYVKLMGVSMIV
jgi:hypothetical protein